VFAANFLAAPKSSSTARQSDSEIKRGVGEDEEFCGSKMMCAA
jgi:hypothetical protein